jgi:hypothetical protein
MIRTNGITVDRQQHAVAYRGACYLSPIKLRLVEALICDRPKTRRGLLELLYWHADGDPPAFISIITVYFSQLREPLARIGLTIASQGPRGSKVYWIEPAAEPVGGPRER